MIQTEVAGGIVLNSKGEVAVVSNQGNFWGLPKGHIDPGEDALTAAKREILEETGISQLTLIKAYPIYQRYRGTPDGGDDVSELKTIYMFLFSTDEEKLAPQDPQNPEARWMKPEDVVAMLTHPKDKEFFQAADIIRS